MVDASADDPVRAPRDGRWPGLWPLVELFALTGLAVTQPVVDVFANGSEVFVLEGAERMEIVAFAVTVAVVPAAVLFGAEALVGLAGAPVRRVFHRIVLAGLFGLFAMELTEDLAGASLGRNLVITAGVMAAAGFLVLVWTVDAVQPWLRVLAIAPVAFVAIFLFTPPMSELAFGSSTDPADVSVGRPAPVVLIVLDELPTTSLLDGRGRIDRDRFPGFAELAEDATWYRNHTTVAPTTGAAVRSILTGRYPDEVRRAPVAASYPENLFTLLGGTYDVHVRERLTQLCPTSICQQDVQGGGLPALLREAADVWTVIARPDRFDQAIDFSAQADDQGDQAAELEQTATFVRSGPSSRPRLDFVHAVLPHGPWELLPSGQRYEPSNPPDGVVFNGFWPDAREADLFHQRHLLQMQATDEVVGRTVERLREAGTYDDTMLVVIADHGISFRADEPHRGVSAGNYPNIVWTPLLVKAPFQDQGSTSDTPVRSIDVLPTIADQLEVDIPWTVDGRSLLRPHEDAPVRVQDWANSELEPGPGGFATIDGETGFDRMLAWEKPLVTEREELLGFQWGPYGRLVGQRVSLVAGPRSSLEGRFDDPAVIGPVDPHAEVLPAYVSGEITVPGEEAVAVAIAVDGVVGAVETTFGAEGDDRRFDAVLPPALLGDGGSRLTLHVVEGPPELPRLRAVDVR